MLVLVLLAGCSPESVPVELPAVPEMERIPIPDWQETDFGRGLREIEESLEEATPQQVVEGYLSLHYLSYLHMESVDLSGVLDFRLFNLRNLDLFQEHLVQRRRLIREMELCYVETQEFPYTVRYLTPEEVNDGRLERWEGWDFEDGAEVMLHFVVEGEPGRAYPPLLAVGGHQTVRLRRVGTSWKITFLYFPGAARKFYTRLPMALWEDDTVREALLREFGQEEPTRDTEQLFSLAGRSYDPALAASYAKRYTLEPNPAFYHAGDWAGNCMNFISQCLLHGFGDGRIPIPVGDHFAFTTDDWYGGEGGGIPAWENVDYFWAFATDPSGPMTGRVFSEAAALSLGDLIQTQPVYPPEDDPDPDDFAHALLVVDGDTLMLAQNSPANFVYYSDLVDVNLRYYRPQALITG